MCTHSQSPSDDVLSVSQIAAMLPESLACDSPRTRIVCVAEILRRFSDAGHPLSNRQIRDIIEKRFGVLPAENSIADDIKVLREIGICGYRAYTTPQGSYMVNEHISSSDVRLLLNMVQSSRMLTSEQSDKLQGSIMDQLSVYQAIDVDGQVYVDQPVAMGDMDVTGNCDIIIQAMEQGRQVEFVCTRMGFDGQPHDLAGDDGSFVHVETPVKLVFEDGRYVMESYAEQPGECGQHVARWRVDRMRAVRVSKKDASLLPCSAHAAQQSVLFLRVRDDRLDEVFDAFGFGLRFEPPAGERDGEHSWAVTCVRVSDGASFFRWLAGMGGGVLLVEPPFTCQQKVRSLWQQEVSGKTIDDLMTDYRAACEGYRAFLSQAQGSVG